MQPSSYAPEAKDSTPMSTQHQVAARPPPHMHQYGRCKRRQQSAHAVENACGAGSDNCCQSVSSKATEPVHCLDATRPCRLQTPQQPNCSATHGHDHTQECNSWAQPKLQASYIAPKHCGCDPLVKPQNPVTEAQHAGWGLMAPTNPQCPM